MTGRLEAIESRTRKIEEATSLQEMMSSMQELQRELAKQNAKHNPAASKEIVKKLQADGFPMFQIDSAGNISISARSSHSQTRVKNSAEGVDVSSFQDRIDWGKARHEVDFAMIKASEGSTIADAKFASNWDNTTKAGVMRGAYHFFRPKTDVQEQVQNFCAPFKHHYNGDLPPALDLEDAHLWKGMSQKQKIKEINEWMKGVEHELHVQPIIYTNTNFYQKVLKNTAELKKYPLWIADWRDRSTPEIPKPWQGQGKEYLFWQYDAFGKIPGVSGRVDCDYYKGTMAELRNIIIEQRKIAAGDEAAVGHLPAPRHRHPDKRNGHE
ncbi:MAG TPA: GH25 family lysozyme [Planktothrix sp.]